MLICRLRCHCLRLLPHLFHMMMLPFLSDVYDDDIDAAAITPLIFYLAPFTLCYFRH